MTNLDIVHALLDGAHPITKGREAERNLNRAVRIAAVLDAKDAELAALRTTLDKRVSLAEAVAEATAAFDLLFDFGSKIEACQTCWQNTPDNVNVVRESLDTALCNWRSFRAECEGGK